MAVFPPSSQASYYYRLSRSATGHFAEPHSDIQAPAFVPIFLIFASCDTGRLRTYARAYWTQATDDAQAFIGASHVLRHMSDCCGEGSGPRHLLKPRVEARFSHRSAESAGFRGNRRTTLLRSITALETSRAGFPPHEAPARHRGPARPRRDGAGARPSARDSVAFQGYPLHIRLRVRSAIGN